eukprot:TRINITY_DN2731_c0_g1_i5.p1 TRINITY_DN2731_c0_g1~~TRINITY_DN2731_c0_g1_i5.p1  ORF type:complete len:109 (-),score=8.18 TRINITY_DN2731_c0_g1_i5:294-620(-)
MEVLTALTRLKSAQNALSKELLGAELFNYRIPRLDLDPVKTAPLDHDWLAISKDPNTHYKRAADVHLAVQANIRDDVASSPLPIFPLTFAALKEKEKVKVRPIESLLV